MTDSSVILLSESLKSVTEAVNCDLNNGADINVILSELVTYVVYLQKITQDLIFESNAKSMRAKSPKLSRMGTRAFVDAQSDAINEANHFGWRDTTAGITGAA